MPETLLFLLPKVTRACDGKSQQTSNWYSMLNSKFFDVDPHPHFNVAVAGQILPLVQIGIFLCFCVIVIYYYYYYLLYGY